MRHGSPGEETSFNLDRTEGGSSIEYKDEDPQFRKDAIAALETQVAQFQMPEPGYRRDALEM